MGIVRLQEGLHNGRMRPGPYTGSAATGTHDVPT